MAQVAVIILAAGLGKRMQSQKAKVLHTLDGIPMIMHVMKTAKKLAGENIVIVVGHQAEKVQEVVSSGYKAIFAMQSEQLGTAHAVSCATPYLSTCTENVLILYGDVPLVKSQTIEKLIDEHVRKGLDVTLLAVEVDNPKGYGRIILNSDGKIVEIVEESDATDTQKNIKLINSGIYCVRKQFLIESLAKIKPNNAQKEYYLTDIIRIGQRMNKNLGIVKGDDPLEIAGINSISDLQYIESIVKNRHSEIS